MQLRPMQEIAVSKIWETLEGGKDNTLMVAPTGYGKTITMAGIVQEGIQNHDVKKALTIQHREELVDQNLKKFRTFTNDKYTCSVMSGDTKSFRGKHTFGMVQTLSRNLSRIPKLDLIQIDEAHRSPSKTYVDVLNAARDKNPDLKIVGVTATPVRGDGKTLNVAFNNVCYIAEMAELIANGYLVPPVTYKPQIGGLRAEINSVDELNGEFNMEQAASLLNSDIVNGEVFRHWKEKAGNKKTVVFCANKTHARSVTETFRSNGVSVEMLTSDIASGNRQDPAPGTRRRILRDFEQNKFQVLINVMILTEGFDDQRIGCVVILRPASARSTFIQIIGRGLRKVDMSLYPGWIKTNCIVLDFCSEHDSLEQDISEAFIQKLKQPSLMKDKICPKCMADLPPRARECYICGHEFPPAQPTEKMTIDQINMVEIDLLAKSRFSWVDLFDNQRTLMATGFNSWCIVLQPSNDDSLWMALACKKDENGISEPIKVLDVGNRIQCISTAHDWTSLNEKASKSGKKRSWLSSPCTDKQANIVERFGRWDDVKGMTKYGAACRIEYMYNERLIRGVVEDAMRTMH